MSEDEKRILKLPKHGPVSFVLVIFAMVAVYFLVQGIILLNHHSIQIYDVNVASDDNAAALHKGIILRNEVTVESPAKGYLSYYTMNGEWVSKERLICSVDQNGNVEEKLRMLFYGHSTLTQSARQKIQAAIRNAVESYDNLNFDTVFRAKGDVEASVLNALINESGDLSSKLVGMSYVPCYSGETGFFMNWFDGLENAAAENLDSSVFLTENYSRTELRGGNVVNEGEPVYKLAPDNRFTLSFLMSDAEIASYGTKKTLSVRMEDGLELTGSFSLKKTADGKNLGVLTFLKYGGNYLSERFRSFRILDKSVSGFKIPESSIVTKSFFVVPERFVSQGGGGNQWGVSTKNADGSTVFHPATVYFRDTTENAPNFIIGEGVAYVMGEDLYAGMEIQSSGDLAETMKLGVKASVEGCFQVNNGYCIFKPIVRIQNSIDTSYVIVSDRVKGSLKSYDRIVLYGEGHEENEIIFE